MNTSADDADLEIPEIDFSIPPLPNRFARKPGEKTEICIDGAVEYVASADPVEQGPRPVQVNAGSLAGDHRHRRRRPLAPNAVARLAVRGRNDWVDLGRPATRAVGTAQQRRTGRVPDPQAIDISASGRRSLRSWHEFFDHPLTRGPLASAAAVDRRATHVALPDGREVSIPVSWFRGERPADAAGRPQAHRRRPRDLVGGARRRPLRAGALRTAAHVRVARGAHRRRPSTAGEPITTRCCRARDAPT